MAYEKHIFVDGEVLTAEAMNKIENGIETNSLDMESLKQEFDALAEDFSKLTFIDNSGEGDIVIGLPDNSDDELA